jgi:hypothetical protein
MRAKIWIHPRFLFLLGFGLGFSNASAFPQITGQPPVLSADGQEGHGGEVIEASVRRLGNQIINLLNRTENLEGLSVIQISDFREAIRTVRVVPVDSRMECPRAGDGVLERKDACTFWGTPPLTYWYERAFRNYSPAMRIQMVAHELLRASRQGRLDETYALSSLISSRYEQLIRMGIDLDDKFRPASTLTRLRFRPHLDSDYYPQTPSLLRSSPTLGVQSLYHFSTLEGSGALAFRRTGAYAASNGSPWVPLHCAGHACFYTFTEELRSSRQEFGFAPGWTSADYFCAGSQDQGRRGPSASRPIRLIQLLLTPLTNESFQVSAITAWRCDPQNLAPSLDSGGLGEPMIFTSEHAH